MCTRTVVIADVGDESAADRTLDALEQLGPDGVVLYAGAVVHRSPDGRIEVGRVVGDPLAVPERPEHPRLTAALAFVVGTFDTLVLGNSLMSVGPPVDPRAEVVERLARSIAPGRTAVMAELTEPDPSAVDRVVAEAGGTVERYEAGELESGTGDPA